MSRGRLLRRLSALVGIMASAGAALLYVTLPDVRPLRTVNPTTTAFMELRDREAERSGRTPRRTQQWAALDEMSPNLPRAVLVAEDVSFWEHPGYSLDKIWAALKLNLERREIVRGGSTITQQLAKNLYLSPAKTPWRKLRELLIARRLEAELDKCRILEIYLNVIEWGDGIYGAEAAAQTYFHKPATDLDVTESALMAGAIMNPRVLNPAKPSLRLLNRELRILGATSFFPTRREPGR
jgi:monofunctional biosynthetic peptidoglycan transglycosylase